MSSPTKYKINFLLKVVKKTLLLNVVSRIPGACCFGGKNEEEKNKKKRKKEEKFVTREICCRRYAC